MFKKNHVQNPANYPMSLDMSWKESVFMDYQITWNATSLITATRRW
jgi:hypothetical protein